MNYPFVCGFGLQDGSILLVALQVQSSWIKLKNTASSRKSVGDSSLSTRMNPIFKIFVRLRRLGSREDKEFVYVRMKK